MYVLESLNDGEGKGVVARREGGKKEGREGRKVGGGREKEWRKLVTVHLVL